MNKETLEEASKKYATNHGMMAYMSTEKKESFKKGAKWQAERMYSDEEVIQLLIKFNQEIQEVEDVRIWFEKFKNRLARKCFFGTIDCKGSSCGLSYEVSVSI